MRYGITPFDAQESQIPIYPAYYLTDYNRLTDRYGNWLTDGKHPTGSWLQVNNKALSFISSSHLDPVSNTLQFFF